LKALLELLRAKEAGQLRELRELDLQWAERREGLGAALAGIHQRLSFLQKWSGQIRESVLGLELP
jgi:hypothetical protein